MKKITFSKAIPIIIGSLLVCLLFHSSPALAWEVLDPPPYLIITRQDGDYRFGDYISMGKVYMEGQEYSQDPVMENGRMLVPLRQFAEVLGYAPNWNGADSSISMTDGMHTVWMQIDNPIAIKDGSAVALDSPPRLVNERTMVPLRFIAEAAGYSINTCHSPANVYFISYYAYLSGKEMDGLSDMADYGDEDIYTTPSGISIGDSHFKVIDTYGLPCDGEKKDSTVYPGDYTGTFWYSDFEAFQCGSYGLVIEVTNGLVSRMYMAH